MTPGSAEHASEGEPGTIVVLSRLFPHSGQPRAGLFVAERMLRLARQQPLVVVSPTPWFPLQGLIRRFRPHFRPPAPRQDSLGGVPVYCPRFFCVPGLFKRWDGLFMALACRRVLRRLQRRGRLALIDAHFLFPDGEAAARLARRLDVPYTVTLRGTEPRQARQPALRRAMARAVAGAARVIAVSDSLRCLALELGAPAERTCTIGNGVDTGRFFPRGRAEARLRLGLPAQAPVLVSVGTLVERKGFHRVIDLLPELLERFPDLHYLVVGGAGPEGDWEAHLRSLVRRLGLQERVHFLGHVEPAELSWPLSAADVFVLSTANEGWANVFLEAMACGLPVVSTDVGGNREVICDSRLGTIVPFGDRAALRDAVIEALGHPWDRDAIRSHAEANSWERRLEVLQRELQMASACGPPKRPSAVVSGLSQPR